jgi:hypothetical protein
MVENQGRMEGPDTIMLSEDDWWRNRSDYQIAAE